MLEIRGLRKKYGDFQALDGLDLEIPKGELFGFVGPNGAGKTTTLKIVAGLLAPDEGEVRIDGVDAVRNNRTLREKIGYVPDFFGSLRQSEGIGIYGVFCIMLWNRGTDGQETVRSFAGAGKAGG